VTARLTVLLAACWLACLPACADVPGSGIPGLPADPDSFPSGDNPDEDGATLDDDDVQGASCGDATCDEGEDCATCPEDCGDCPPDCGDDWCAPDEHCADGPDGLFCTLCDPAACDLLGMLCCQQTAHTDQCTDPWHDPLNCGGCGQSCPTGQDCLTWFEPVDTGPFCTSCDPVACGESGQSCCPGNAPDGGCTNTLIDRSNCGGCDVACAADEVCNAGVCEGVDSPTACAFDPMQWWRSPTDHDSRDITFVAIGDTHAEDETTGCPNNSNGLPDQNTLAREAIASVLPGDSWTSHLWPAGANFYREDEPYDHVRGLLIAGDLVQAGSQSIPAGVQDCWEYVSYRDAYGRCGDEGRLPFPVYEAHGNHDYPRVAGDGDASFHPVIDSLDLITAAHRPGASNHKYDDTEPGTGLYAWRWDDIWFVNLGVKAGWLLEELSGNQGTRIVDPHGSRAFLKRFLLSRSDNPTRQLVLLSHYKMNAGRVDGEEKESFCRLIHNAQHGTGSFSSQKLSHTHPIVAFVHGHDHQTPERVDWTCPSPYDDITIPQYSVGTPFYGGNQNGGDIRFTIFRLGSHYREVVGVAASPGDPTGAWTYTFLERQDVMRDP